MLTIKHRTGTVGPERVSCRGARVCRALAMYHQDTCLGTHCNLLAYGAPSFWRNPIITLKTILGQSGLPGGYSADDLEGMKRVQQFVTTETGYMRQQGTRPQVCHF
jgi:hypothetical protein